MRTLYQRGKIIQDLHKSNYIKSPKVKDAMLKVPREKFVPPEYLNDAYSDIPLPIPGGQTISAPHMHAITLSELDLKEGNNVLEVGAGSGILLAYIREIIGNNGKAVGIEINKETYKFGKDNLEKAGYADVTLIRGDGSLGYPKNAPYDKIVVSAASPDIPKPLVEQLKINGTMLIVVDTSHGQYLVKIKKMKSGRLTKKELFPVRFVPLKGKHGWK